MKIFYVHHALRDKGNPPTQQDGLKELGRIDADLVGKLFNEINNERKIIAIYSSTYYRCMETARLINNYLNVPIIEDERLNEFVGVHQAVKGDKVQTEVESWMDCQNRIQDCLKDIVYKHNDKDVVLCVTSGVNITAFINVAYGMKADLNRPFPWVPSCSPIGFEINKSHFEEIVIKGEL